MGPREAIWLHFWAAIQEHPWLGYGFGQGVLALREVAAHVRPSRNTIYAHNFVLDLMTWVGIPLGLALAAALGGWMLSWLRRGESLELDCPAPLGLCLLAGAGGSVVAGVSLRAYVLPAAGSVARRGHHQTAVGCSRPERCAESAASRPALALAALATVLLALTTWDYLQFEAEFRANRFDKARFAQSAGTRAATAARSCWTNLAALNASSALQSPPGHAAGGNRGVGRFARRFHLLPTRIEYAKALALNGRLAEAQAELQMIRGVYHPERWALIERDWLDWLEQHRADLQSRRRAMVPRLPTSMQEHALCIPRCRDVLPLKASVTLSELSMPTKLTSKGQVTIPKRIRDALQLLPGSAVEFSINAGGEVVLHPPRVPKAGLRMRKDRFDAVRGRAEVPWRTDDLMKLLRADD